MRHRKTRRCQARIGLQHQAVRFLDNESVRDSQILSTYHDSALAGLEPGASASGARRRTKGQFHPLVAPARSVLVFDACHAGLVLRAVGGMAVVLAVATLFSSTKPRDWGLNYLLLTAVATPGLLAWLMVCCALKGVIGRLALGGQWVAGVGLGAAAGAMGYGVVQWSGLIGEGFLLASSAAGALLSAILVAALMWRAKAQLPAATSARLVELQARIRPHFLFNALNSAMALVRDDPARAEAVLEDLSELFRHALAESSSDVSLADELALARSYLQIEETRFGERMQVEWVLDPAAASARVPPLILQPLVENAVKHGVEASAGVTQIKVSTVKRGSTVVVRVTNTLDDAAPARAGHGIALANVRERLALLHDVQASFQTVRKDGVFQARMEIPVGSTPSGRAT